MNSGYSVSKFVSILFALISVVSCGGGGGGSAGSSSGGYMSINGTTYADVANTTFTTVEVVQTSIYNYKLGGPAISITMSDKTSGNYMNISTAITASGLPSVNSLGGFTGDTFVNYTEKINGTTNLMGDFSNPSVTNGSVTIKTLGDVGQQLTGSFDMNLCALNTTCSATVKKYKGDFSATRYSNYGSMANPGNISLSGFVTTLPQTHGIAPATGANYYKLTTKATAGTATITVKPTTDVDVAVFSDAAYTTAATCDVTSTLNVTGSGLETCAISVSANQVLYFKVSQKTGVTALDTYTVNVVE